MAKFKDSQGTEWAVRFVLPMVKPLREAGYDLGKIDAKGGALDALTDPETLGRIMWVACEAQADKLGVTEAEFAARFDGPTLHAAVEAVYEATADFTQRPAVAAEIRKALPGAMGRTDQAAIRRLEAVMTPAIRSGSTDSGTNSPASPDSTPPG